MTFCSLRPIDSASDRFDPSPVTLTPWRSLWTFASKTPSGPVPGCHRFDVDLLERSIAILSFVLRIKLGEEGPWMTTLLEHERTVLPPEQPIDELSDLLGRTDAESVTISRADGEHMVLPRAIFDALREVVDAMTRGKAVVIAPVHQLLTTQDAADLLGISRPTLVKLLEEGEIPYDRPGRHRRVRLVDVLDYRSSRSTQRREALDRMVEIAEQSGMYERTATPKRTR